MTSNIGKRLDKLHREISEIGAKGGAFHFIIGTPDEDAEAKLERMKAEGTIARGDEYQLVEIPWRIRPLRGQALPAGVGEAAEDPFRDPGHAMPSVTDDASAEREQRWKAHLARIEMDGTRYQGDGESPLSLRERDWKRGIV
jgi:hypothetical protein